MSESIKVRIRDSDRQRQSCAYCHERFQSSFHRCPSCATCLHDDCLRELGRCPTLGCKANEPWRAEAQHPTLGGAQVAPVLGFFQKALKILLLLFVALPCTIYSGLAAIFGILAFFGGIAALMQGPDTWQFLTIFAGALFSLVFVPLFVIAFKWSKTLFTELSAPSRPRPDSSRRRL
jgi:hypothetical protein